MVKMGRGSRLKVIRLPSAELNESFVKNRLIVILSPWMDTFSRRRQNPSTSWIEKWPLRSMPS